MAMDYKLDAITHSTTGVKTWTVGFQAKKVRLVVVPAPGSTFTFVRRSEGVHDGTNVVCDSETVETTRMFQRRYTDRMACISEWTGAAWAEVYKITFDSITATEVKYNVTQASATFQVQREAEA